MAWPIDAQASCQAVQASLRLLEIAPLAITLPLYASLWLSVLGQATVSLFLAGQTGIGKSALAALLQQHSGAELDAQHLPANWSSSANALEALAFTAKDAVLVVDEFTPTDAAQAQMLYRTAERLFRAQANRSARQRMRADTTLRPAKPPRGLLLATGEDLPKGTSLLARLVVIEIAPDALDFARVTRCQADAAAGLYAQALGAFVHWMAPQYATVQRNIPSQLAAFRQRAHQSTLHRRTPENVARLALGWHYFLRFAEASGALSAAEAEQWWTRGWEMFGQVAQGQARYLTQTEPTQRFVTLLREALGSGRAHMATPTGGVPNTPRAWGWRLKVVGTGEHARDEWQPQGERLGWVEGDLIYVLPEASYAVAQGLGKDIGDPLTVSPYTLRKRLKERGWLALQEASRETILVRKTFEGQRHAVLAINLAAFSSESPLPEKPDQPDQPDQQPENHRNGQVFGRDWSGSGQEKSPLPDHDIPLRGMEFSNNGQVGQEKYPVESPEGEQHKISGQVSPHASENLTTKPDHNPEESSIETPYKREVF